MTKAYIIVFHQCFPTLKNDLEAYDTFSIICSNQDRISLLKLIQSLCCLYDAKMQGVMATIASHKHLYKHYQKDGVDNHTYHWEFLAHVETLETYGGLGVVGVVSTFMAAKIKEMVAANLIADATCPTDAEHALALNAVRDEYLAALMLNGTHHDRFSGLHTDLKNQYGYRDDRYPKTIDACLSLLNCWTPLGQKNLCACLDLQLQMINTKKKMTMKHLSLLRMLINPLAVLVLLPRKIPPQTRTSPPPTRRNLQMYAARSATSLVIHRRYVPNQNLLSKYTQSMPMLMMHPL